MCGLAPWATWHLILLDNYTNTNLTRINLPNVPNSLEEQLSLTTCTKANECGGKRKLIAH